ncbi:MAG: NAD-dependent epimerase/dehydratase family protein [Candidatus Omnitrophica bacterium]|nr:NAD-dependent epimerase/dehydratase family protein [Candidatus Omnitrophota bacterium]
MNEIKKYFEGKNIFVSGGTGSIGSGIVKQLLEYNVETIRVFSNDENSHFKLQQRFRNHPKLRYLIGDVRDRIRLKKAVEGVDIIFHAAALKHVPFCEYNPFEAVNINVLGTQNLIDAALEANVDKMVTISTDKAASPTNVMGSTKLLAERLTSSADYYKGYKKTVFCSVRFGNVLASRGSVIPIFMDQIKAGGPVTVTDMNTTRFIMSISRAVELVIKATVHSFGGEIFIFKMQALKIGELASVMIDKYAVEHKHNKDDIKLKKIGSRDGEKLYEELMTPEESKNAYETGEMFILMPSQIVNKKYKAYKKSRAKYKNYKKAKIQKYSSDQAELLSKKRIDELLEDGI